MAVLIWLGDPMLIDTTEYIYLISIIQYLYIIVEAKPQPGQEHLSEPEGKYLLISDMKAIFKIIY